MNINYIIYLSEIIALVLALIIGLIIFKAKHKKGYLKFLGISIVVFLVIFAVSLILEKPQVDSYNLANLEVQSGENIGKIKAMYHFKDISDKVKVIGDIDYNKVGEYDVKLEIDTLIGKYSQDAKIKIVDTKKPEIALVGGEQFNLSYGKEYEEIGFIATDEYEGDLTENVTITREDIDETHFNIKYEVSDSSGNKDEKIRYITIVDDVPPVITLKGNSVEYVYVNGTYTEKGATATDEKDGDLTEKIAISGTVDSATEGNYTITYSVSDNSGNEATLTRTVVVKKYLKAQDGGGQGAGVIYLTFDDGPSQSSTPKILEILAKKNVKATFFILNYDAAGEELVKREYNEGHAIGIHGYSHTYSEIYQSEETYMNNITKLQDKIYNSIGIRPTITRFPGGSSNTVSRFNPGIMTRLTKLVVERGFKYYDWNVSSGDAGGASSSDAVYKNVTSQLSKSKMNVVLMHDFSGNTKTINALEAIIDYGIENGYTFSTITADTPMVTHGVNN